MQTIKLRNIYVCGSPALGYTRGIIRGVTDFMGQNATWNVISMESHTFRFPLDLETADGLIVHSLTEEEYEVLRKYSKPIVGVSSAQATAPYPRVIPDNVAIGRIGAEHLISAGCRHLAFLGIEGHMYSEQREQGFEEVARKAGIPVLHSPPKIGGGEIYRWAATLPTPIGVMVANDMRAIRLMHAAKQQGLRVPEDVAVLGVDNDDLLIEMVRPRLTSVDVNAPTVGYRAAALLEDLMNGGAAPEKPIIVQPRGLVERQSTDILNIQDEEVASAVRYIRSNSERPITVEAIAEQLMVSRRWLERKFQETLQRSPAEILRKARVDRARALLVSSDLTVTEIAVKSGFSSGQQLSETFTKLVGTSPRDYRKQITSR